VQTFQERSGDRDELLTALKTFQVAVDESTFARWHAEWSAAALSVVDTATFFKVTHDAGADDTSTSSKAEFIRAVTERLGGAHRELARLMSAVSTALGDFLVNDAKRRLASAVETVASIGEYEHLFVAVMSNLKAALSAPALAPCERTMSEIRDTQMRLISSRLKIAESAERER
jgi:hypothetical protein